MVNKTVLLWRSKISSKQTWSSRQTTARQPHLTLWAF